MKFKRYIWLNIWFAILIIGGFVFYDNVIKGRKKRSIMRYDLRPDSTLMRGLPLPKVPDSMRLCEQTLAIPPTLRMEIISAYYRQMRTEADLIILIRRYHQWKNVVQQALKHENIPQDLLYLAGVRTGFDPVNLADSWGLWALDSTWFVAVDTTTLDTLGKDRGYDEKCNARCNAAAGAAAWAQRLTAHTVMLSPQNIVALLHPSPQEQQRLLAEWLVLSSIMQHPAIWGLSLPPAHLPIPY